MPLSWLFRWCFRAALVLLSLLSLCCYREVLVLFWCCSRCCSGAAFVLSWCCFRAVLAMLSCSSRLQFAGLTEHHHSCYSTGGRRQPRTASRGSAIRGLAVRSGRLPNVGQPCQMSAEAYTLRRLALPNVKQDWHRRMLFSCCSHAALVLALCCFCSRDPYVVPCDPYFVPSTP